MNRNSIPDEDELKEYLSELRSRLYKTKFFLVKILIELGMGWHSFEEIRKSVLESGVAVSHLAENLIELARVSFVETDFEEKYYPKLSSFKVKDEAFLLLTNVLQSFEN